MLLSSLVVPLFAQAAAPAGAPAGAPIENWYTAPWLLLLAAIATIVVPYLLGNLSGNMLRMPDYGWKIGLILVALVAGVVIDVAGVLTHSIKRGIDLSGGVKLVYEIDQEKLQEVNVDAIVQHVAEEVNRVGAFSKRDPAKVIPGKGGMLEIRLPTTDDDRIKKVQAALSSFDLSAQSAELTGPVSVRTEDKQTVLTYRATRTKASVVPMDKLIEAVQRRVNPGGQLEVAIRQLGADQIEVDIPDVSASEIDTIKKKISTAGSLEFHIVADQNAPQDFDVVEAAKQQMTNGNMSNEVSNGQMIVGRWVDVDPTVAIERNWLTRPGKNGALQVLMVADNLGVTGQYLTDARLAYGISGAEVEFDFDTNGARRFGQLTGQNLPQQNGLKRWLGIVLDGQLKSAATINDKITNSGRITGNFTEEEVNFIVGVLNAGALPAALEKNPVSEEQISAELGRDTIHSSEMAMIISGVVVLVFMLLYYRFAGVVADAAVLFNLLLVLAFMIVLKAAFTLAGLAGLVLSIGMAVDSNVLIYERMREEKERGAALRMVIRNGFGRAMATIIDMHSTTIITGIVLYLIGTEQLRGFAVTLVLGLLVNLFTAVFCARVVFDVAERKRWLTQLKMTPWILGDTAIDFVRIMVPAICVSILISVLGVVCFWHREVVGPGMFDTDFTGGTEVHIVLRPDKPMSDAEVRALVEPDTKYLPDATVVAVEQKENTQFIIRTSNQQPTEVKNELVKLFGNKLQTYGVSLANLHAITPAEAKASAASAAEANPQEQAKPPAEAKPPAQPAEPTKPTSPNPSPPSPPPGSATSPSNSSAQKSTPPPAKTNTPPSAPAAPTAPKSSGANKSSATARPPLGPLTGRSALVENAVALSPVALSSVALSPVSLSANLLLADASSSPTPPPAKPPASTPAAAAPASAAPPSVPPAAAKPASAAPANASQASPSATQPSTQPAPAAPTAPAGKTPPNPSAATSEFGETAAASGPAAFVGGTETGLHFSQPVPYDGLEPMLHDALGNERFELTNPQSHPGDRTAYDSWTLRVALPPAQAGPILERFRDTLDKTPVFLGVSNIGGRVASDTQTTALYALLASIAMIVVYIWIRFQNVIYGVGAVVALIHDVFITVAALAISSYVAQYLGFLLVDPFKISLNVVAAILTICGYSISDTIVIFDRIREVRGKSPDLTPEIINLSVNQTLSRTVLTVFTVLLVTLILYISGGQAIHAFAFTMLVGLISGTYSSVYIAAPCLLWMRTRKPQGTTRVQ